MSGPPPPPPWGPPVPPPPVSTTAAPTGRQPWAIVGAAAVLVLLAGTFLPWIRSGRISRNSYELAGLGARRLGAGPFIDAMLRVWPFLGPLWAVVVVLLVLGQRRTGAALTLALGGFSALVAAGGVVLAVRVDSALIGGVLLGPVVTLGGAVTTVVAAVAVLRERRHRADGWPGAPSATGR